MLGAAGLLTLVTLTGLAAGLAREWLLVASWGATARTDGFLIAMFIPEALRMVLAGGVLSAAGMALWQQRSEAERPQWLGRLTLGLGVLSVALALVLWLGAPWWVRLVGPGLAPAQQGLTQAALQALAWSVPGMVLAALWAVPLQASGRFVLAGMGSLLYNLPAIVYMGWWRGQGTEAGLGAAFVLGSVLMSLVMLPSAWRLGLRPAGLRWHRASMAELGGRISPLMGGAMMAQGLMLAERIVASYLGEGVVTVLNLARKLVNLPLVALMSINQVLLGLMSKGSADERLPLLRRGLALVTTVTTPAAVGLMLSAQALVLLLFPDVHGTEVLGPVLGWYAVTLVVASWNTLLARYNYAAGDTRLPFTCELAGSIVNALALPLLAWLWGAQGMAAALLLGVLVNGALLVHRNGLWGRLSLGTSVVGSALALGLSGWVLAPWLPGGAWPQLLWATAAGTVCLLALGLALRPWKPVTS